jgi:hypothetical protein
MPVARKASSSIQHSSSGLIENSLKSDIVKKSSTHLCELQDQKQAAATTTTRQDQDKSTEAKEEEEDDPELKFFKVKKKVKNTFQQVGKKNKENHSLVKIKNNHHNSGENSILIKVNQKRKSELSEIRAESIEKKHKTEVNTSGSEKISSSSSDIIIKTFAENNMYDYRHQSSSIKADNNTNDNFVSKSEEDEENLINAFYQQRYLGGSNNSIATLCNIGNSCYLNSVIYTLRFAPYFLHKLHHLCDDMHYVYQKIGQNKLKSSSLGRNISGLQVIKTFLIITIKLN